MSPPLGCAQNLDGSLKDASEIQWQYSHSSSPVDLSTSINATGLTLPLNLANLSLGPPQREPPKRRHHAKALLRKIHPGKSLTGAVRPALWRVALTLADRLEIVEFAENEGQSLSQSKIATHFQDRFPKINQSTISQILRKKESLLELATSNPAQLGFKRTRAVKVPEVERILCAFHLQQEGSGRAVTGPILMQKAQKIAEHLGVTDFKFSNGWLQSYKQRYNVRHYRFHGEAASVDKSSVSQARSQIQTIIGEYQLRDVYNFDESGLFYRMPPDRGLASSQLSGVKGDKTRITLGFTVNADGSDIRAPIFIGHARRPRCFDKKDASAFGFSYYWNKKAWMTASIFQCFLHDLNANMKSQNRHIILLVDNAPSHIFNESKLTNVHVEFLDPNMTAHIQPLDAGIICAFKARYRSLYCSMILDNDENGRENIYRIDQLYGMRLAMEAWHGISTSTVANCWQHTGILNLDTGLQVNGGRALDPNDFPALGSGSTAEAEQELANGLAKLVAADMVTARSCLTAREMLEMVEEAKTEDSWTVEDLIEQEMLDEREANGEHIEELDGDPVVNSEDVCVFTLREAYSAVSGLEVFLHSRTGDLPAEARTHLHRLKQYLRGEMNASLQQQSILSYFNT